MEIQEKALVSIIHMHMYVHASVHTYVLAYIYVHAYMHANIRTYTVSRKLNSIFKDKYFCPLASVTKIFYYFFTID